MIPMIQVYSAVYIIAVDPLIIEILLCDLEQFKLCDRVKSLRKIYRLFVLSGCAFSSHRLMNW